MPLLLQCSVDPPVKPCTVDMSCNELMMSKMLTECGWMHWNMTQAVLASVWRHNLMDFLLWWWCGGGFWKRVLLDLLWGFGFMVIGWTVMEEEMEFISMRSFVERFSRRRRENQGGITSSTTSCITRIGSKIRSDTDRASLIDRGRVTHVMGIGSDSPSGNQPHIQFRSSFVFHLGLEAMFISFYLLKRTRLGHCFGLKLFQATMDVAHKIWTFSKEFF
ncbi:hypothetical protein D5086_027350 [Populus alba]|uniref:Uncharacterized protein n=1 Tax=Populus alba TaxID=43335 RepID=A0ACC4AV91_POPAL